MTHHSDEHIAWLEREITKAEDRLDALLYGEALDLSADDGSWEEAETRALGTPEDRLRRTWSGLDQTPTGREPTTTVEMKAAVEDAQAIEIKRLRREVALAQTSEDDLVAEWFVRTGVRR